MNKLSKYQITVLRSLAAGSGSWHPHIILDATGIDYQQVKDNRKKNSLFASCSRAIARLIRRGLVVKFTDERNLILTDAGKALVQSLKGELADLPSIKLREDEDRSTAQLIAELKALRSALVK